MPGRRLELLRLAAQNPKSCVSANFTTRAKSLLDSNLIGRPRPDDLPFHPHGPLSLRERDRVRAGWCGGRDSAFRAPIRRLTAVGVLPPYPRAHARGSFWLATFRVLPPYPRGSRPGSLPDSFRLLWDRFCQAPRLICGFGPGFSGEPRQGMLTCSWGTTRDGILSSLGETELGSAGEQPNEG